MNTFKTLSLISLLALSCQLGGEPLSASYLKRAQVHKFFSQYTAIITSFFAGVSTVNILNLVFSENRNRRTPFFSKPFHLCFGLYSSLITHELIRDYCKKHSPQFPLDSNNRKRFNLSDAKAFKEFLKHNSSWFHPTALNNAKKLKAAARKDKIMYSMFKEYMNIVLTHIEREPVGSLFIRLP